MKSWNIKFSQNNFILCFFLHTDKHLAILSLCTSDIQSMQIFGLVYYLSTVQTSPLHVSCYPYMETNVFLVCSWISIKSYDIFCLTEMFQQLHLIIVSKYIYLVIVTNDRSSIYVSIMIIQCTTSLPLMYYWLQQRAYWLVGSINGNHFESAHHKFDSDQVWSKLSYLHVWHKNHQNYKFH
jgi:hypothetical protein